MPAIGRERAGASVAVEVCGQDGWAEPGHRGHQDTGATGMLEAAREHAGPAGRADSGTFSGFHEGDEGRRL